MTNRCFFALSIRPVLGFFCPAGNGMRFWEMIGLHLSLEYSQFMQKPFYRTGAQNEKEANSQRTPIREKSWVLRGRPSPRQAKELNKQIFAEEFGRNRIEEEPPVEPAGGKGSLTWILLLAVCICVVWLWTESPAEPDSSPATAGPKGSGR